MLLYPSSFSLRKRQRPKCQAPSCDCLKRNPLSLDMAWGMWLVTDFCHYFLQVWQVWLFNCLRRKPQAPSIAGFVSLAKIASVFLMAGAVGLICAKLALYLSLSLSQLSFSLSFSVSLTQYGAYPSVELFESWIMISASDSHIYIYMYTYQNVTKKPI